MVAFNTLTGNDTLLAIEDVLQGELRVHWLSGVMLKMTGNSVHLRAVG